MLSVMTGLSSSLSFTCHLPNALFKRLKNPRNVSLIPLRPHCLLSDPCKHSSNITDTQ